MSDSSTRCLAAILFADIAGYTALMQKDEATASTLLRRFQKELENKVTEGNGQIVNFYGDGALCIFQIPIDAVRCAMALQTTFSEATIPVRIGIHSGTVTFEGDKIFGDSVNLASRIESMGVPGAVLFSKKIRDEIKNQPDLKMASLGSFDFKNVGEPLEVFALSNDGFPVPDQASISGKLKTNEKNNSWLNWKAIIGLLTLGSLLIFLGIKIGETQSEKKGALSAKHFQILLPKNIPMDVKGAVPMGLSLMAFDISPDGKKIVYVGKKDAINKLFLRDLSSWEIKELAGTAGAFVPFFSPDGNWVGFYADKKLKKIKVDEPGKQPVVLCDVSLPNNAIWTTDGNIVFCNNEAGSLAKVSDQGGVPEVLLYQEELNKSTSFTYVAALPEKDFFLISDEDDFLSILDAKTKAQSLLPFRGNSARYLKSGYLAYTRMGQLFAVRFDLKTLLPDGTPVLLASNVMTSTSGISQVALSDNGTFLFVEGPYDREAQLVQVHRDGNIQRLPFPNDNYGTFQLSPNGQQLAIEVTKQHADEIWNYDLQRGTTSRLTSTGNNYGMVWSPYDSSLTYLSKQGEKWGLYKMKIKGQQEAELIYDGRFRAYSYSPDGLRLLGGSSMIKTLQLADPNSTQTLDSSALTVSMPMFSPNGKWYCYVSDESGQYEVYVRSFQAVGQRWQISTGGGEEGQWSRSGDELFYRNGNDWMVVPVQTENDFDFGKPELVFSGPYINVGGHSYLVMPDAQSFLVLEAVDTTSLFTEIRVVENWMESLKE